MKTRSRIITPGLAVTLVFPTLWVAGAETREFWRIGQSDNGYAEFALAPKDYSQFRDDGFFVIGQSDPKRDWPYVQPGPADGWAGGRRHTFTVVFGVKARPGTGECRLELDLLDTQGKAPPVLRVTVNGESFERTTPPGAGDSSIFGQPTKGKEHRTGIEFPARLLKRGNNRIEITTLSGSWVLFDCLTLDAPASITAAPVSPFTELNSVAAVPGGAEHNGSRGGRLLASVTHVGPPVKATFTLDGQLLRTVELSPGRQSLDLVGPAVDRARKTILALRVDGKMAGQREVMLTPGVREIIVVFKTHFDIGYTDMASNVVKRYRTTFMDSALKVVDQNRDLPPEQQFVWTIPGWPMHKILEDSPEQTPERQQRVRQAVKDGRFVVHALPFTTHTELLEPGDLVHGLGYASRLTRGLGLDLPRDAKMTDVPSHSWILPTLLRHAGVDFLHLGCNAASSSPQVPRLFWWEGPDGSRLLTMYTAESYGTGLVPPRDWPYGTWLALIHTGDNHGPPTPEEVKKVLDEAKAKLPGVKVHIGRLSDFGDAIAAERAEIPVVRGDMPDTWIHGPMCDPAGARLARHFRPALVAAESLDTELRQWGVANPAPAETLGLAREQSLLYGEHTWGGALAWITRYSRNTPYWYGEAFKQARATGRFERIEASWAEHSAYIEKARRLLEPPLTEAMSSLARAVAVEGERIVVFNPLPWRRDGVVHVLHLAGGAAVKSSDRNEVLPTWTEGDALCFVARDLPPMGYRTYVRVKSELPASRLRADAGQHTLEGPFFKAILDPTRGAVASLVDRRSGRELVDVSATHGFGQYLYERFDSNQVAAYVKAYVKIDTDWGIAELGKPALPLASEVPYRSASPTDCTFAIEQSHAAVTAVMKSAPGAALPHAVTARLTLYADLPCADLEVTVHDKAADPWPEAGWICLPFKMETPQFRLGRLGGVVDPTRDIVPGANLDLGAIQTGGALFDARGRGAGFCPLDSPLVSLERPGLWRYSRDFKPARPSVFVNLFNNQWTTNFRLWNSGTWTSRVRLWAFSHYEADAALTTPSLEARNPLLAAVADGAPGKLPPTQHGLELSREGVALVAFGPNPDGEGTLLRLWELAGQSGRLTVKLPPGMAAASAQPVDLRGRSVGKSVPIRGGVFRTSLNAFAPASFVLQ